GPLPRMLHQQARKSIQAGRFCGCISDIRHTPSSSLVSHRVCDFFRQSPWNVARGRRLSFCWRPVSQTMFAQLFFKCREL
ncbi:hypothetical protein, partial [Dokdonella sp.]|uniref:hypothetical protein n=1 Tax=Dokdonella sp. TaxID=2291710 RepID=UPI002DD66CCC